MSEDLQKRIEERLDCMDNKIGSLETTIGSLVRAILGAENEGNDGLMPTVQKLEAKVDKIETRFYRILLVGFGALMGGGGLGFSISQIIGG